MKLSTKRMTEKQLLVLCAVCGGVLTLGLGVMLYLGHTDTLAQLKVEEETARQARNMLQEQKSRIPKLRSDIDKLQVELQDNVKQLPNTEDVKSENFYAFIDQAALGTRYDDFKGISLVRFEPVVKKKKKKVKPRPGQPVPVVAPVYFKKHAYHAEYRGTFFQFGKFVNIIENDDRFMNITAFKIQQPKGLNDPLKDFSLKIGTYTYMPNGSADDKGAK